MNNEYQKVPLLITGVTGFIGSHIARAVMSQGYSVVGTTRSPEKATLKGLSGLEILETDLTHCQDLIGKLAGKEIGCVIHCASQQPHPSVSAEKYHEGNVSSLQGLLRLMEKRGIQKMISFSTVTVYGSAVSSRVEEETPVRPDNDYARSKMEADKILEQWCQETRSDAVCLRMPSVFGPGQGGGLVDTYYELARKDEKIEMFSRGLLQRNLLYVAEISQAVSKTLAALDRLKGVNVFLIGSADSPTMADIAQRLAEKMNSKSQIIPVDRPAPVNSHWILNLERVKNNLGFQPKTVAEGIDRYLATLNKGGIHAAA